MLGIESLEYPSPLLLNSPDLENHVPRSPTKSEAPSTHMGVSRNRWAQNGPKYIMILVW